MHPQQGARDPNRYAPPQAKVAFAELPLSAAQLARAQSSVRHAGIALAWLCATFVLQVFIAPIDFTVLAAFLFSYLISFTASHVFLGQAAWRSRRSWVLYGVAPVFLPFLGGALALGFLWALMPQPQDA